MRGGRSHVPSQRFTKKYVNTHQDFHIETAHRNRLDTGRYSEQLNSYPGQYQTGMTNDRSENSIQNGSFRQVEWLCV